MSSEQKPEDREDQEDQEPDLAEMLAMGVTPVHLAVASGNLELVRAVLAESAYPDPLSALRRASSSESCAPSPLLLALDRPGGAHFRMITLLCAEAGADPLLELPLERIDVPVRVASQLPSVYEDDFAYFLRFSLVVSHCLVARLVLDPLAELGREPATAEEPEDPMALLLDMDERARARKLELARSLHLQMFRSLGFGSRNAQDGDNSDEEGKEGGELSEEELGELEEAEEEDVEDQEAEEILRLASAVDRIELASVAEAVAASTSEKP